MTTSKQDIKRNASILKQYSKETVKRAPPLNNWNEFRPPLVNYDINNSQIDARIKKENHIFEGNRFAKC